MSEANKEEAFRCIDIAEKAFADKDLQKAEKFIKKSLNLFETPRARQLLSKICPNNNGSQFEQSFSSSTSSASSTFSSSSSRPTRAEEVALIKKILRCEDYYEILGVPKNADSSVMKKSYRKLAMKLHPDKCKAPGAEEAFKKLSAAYGCLSDNNKRKMYDQYGTETPQMRHQYYGDQFQQMTPDDIIRMFFGGDFTSFHSGGGPFGFSHGTGRHHHHRDENDHGSRSQGGTSLMLLQMLPLLFVLVMMVLPSLFLSSSSSSLYSNNSNDVEGTYFSFTKNAIFTQQHQTKTGTEYFTKNVNYHHGYAYRNPKMYEEYVEIAHLKHLIKDCNEENDFYSQQINNLKSNNIDNKQRINLLKKFYKSKKITDYNKGIKCMKLEEYLNKL